MALKPGGPEGFVELTVLYEEGQSHGFTPAQISDAVERMSDKRLIETPHRAAFAEEQVEQALPPTVKYRVTARGAYHLLKWMPTFAYIDAMVFDTPIFDDALLDRIKDKLETFDLDERFARATAFRAYLTEQWRTAEIRASYFNFEALLQRGESTFQSVRSVVRAQ